MFIIRDKTIKFQMTAFLSSQIISQFGSAISGYAIVWYIVMESNSSIIATITTVANMLPGILLTLPAGIMSDKYSKKKIIIIADLLVALITLFFAMTDGLINNNLFIFLPLLILRSCFSGIQAPAANSLIAYIGKSEMLEKYNSFYQSFNTVSGFLAPMLGGFLLSTFSLNVALYLDFFTAILGVTILLFFVKEPSLDISLKEENNKKDPLREIVHYLKSNRGLVNIIFYYGIINFLFSPISFLSPLYIKRYIIDSYYMLTLTQLAWMIGTIGVSISKIVIKSNKDKYNIFLLALSTLAMAMSNSAWIFLITMSIAGYTLTSFTVKTTSYIQSNTQKNLIGRIYSIFSMIAIGLSQAGLFIFGFLGDIAGIRTIFIISGIGILGAFIVHSIIDLKK